MGDKAGVMIDALTWAGTFHGIGARLLREYSDQIGLDQAFYHPRSRRCRGPDESGSARSWIFQDREPLPPPSERASPSTPVASTPRSRSSRSWTTSFPWCSGWATELKQLFAAYVAAKQGQNVLDYDDLLLYWAQMMGDPVLAEDVGSRFDHVSGR